MGIIKATMLLCNVPIFASMVFVLYNYKKLSEELKVFSWFIVVSAIVQCIGLTLWHYSINNLFLNHFFVPIGTVCITVFYNKLFGAFLNSRVVWIILVVFLLLTIANSLFLQPIDSFNSYALTMQCVLVVIFSLATFLLLVNYGGQLSQHINIKSINWINSGLFIYYSSALILFYLGNTIISAFAKEANRYVWMLHSFFYFIMTGCFFIGLWKHLRA